MQRSEITLRTARDGDADIFFDLFAQVQTLHLEAEPGFFRRPAKDEAFAAYFDSLLKDPNQHLIFCCDEARPIGYIQYYLGLSQQTVYQSERRIAHIAQVFVAPEYRRAGLASRLIDHVMEEAEREGATQVGLEMWLFNEAARACFEKVGFRMNQASMWRDVP